MQKEDAKAKSEIKLRSLELSHYLSYFVTLFKLIFIVELTLNLKILIHEPSSTEPDCSLYVTRHIVPSDTETLSSAQGVAHCQLCTQGKFFP